MARDDGGDVQVLESVLAGEQLRVSYA